MSADNGHLVSRLHNNHRRYGIFHYFASNDDPSSFYTEINAIEVHDNPIDAILAGHRIECNNPTEYGLHVNSIVLHDAEKERVDDDGNE